MATLEVDPLKKIPINKILSEIGFAYIADTNHPELGSHQHPSVAVILENGVLLHGPANALHDDIRNLGQGRYCFWNNFVYFSASDNSDPNTNGRRYEIGYPVAYSLLDRFAGFISFRWRSRFLNLGFRIFSYNLRSQLSAITWRYMYGALFHLTLWRGRRSNNKLGRFPDVVSD